MAPALLVDVGLEAFRHPRRGAVIRHSGHAGTAAITAVRSVPRPQGMVLADPADVRAEDAFHRSHQAQRQRKPGNRAGRTQVQFWNESQILRQSSGAVYP
jgi:hypothetical protein